MTLIPILCFLLFCSALLAGSETAFFSLARDKKALKNEELRTQSESPILRLLHHPSRLLMTILLGNLFVNMAFFAFSSVYILQVESSSSAGKSLALSVFFLLLVVLCGEIIPKTIASVSPLYISRLSAPVIYRLTQVLSPLTYGLEKIVHAINRLLGLESSEKSHVDSEHLIDLVDVSELHGSLQESSADMVEKLIRLNDVALKEVCIPRVDVKSCKLGDSVEKVLKKAADWKFFCFPLYDKHHDDISHFVNIADTLGCKLKKNTAIKTLAKPIPYLPELAKMDYVLREFLEKEWSIALVVDEYGDMAGLITWNKIMDYLNIELQNLALNDEPQSHTLVLGRQNIRDLGLIEELKENESVTVSGFLTQLLDRVPVEGEEISYKSMRFKVLKAGEKGVEEVAMTYSQEGGHR